MHLKRVQYKKKKTHSNQKYSVRAGGCVALRLSSWLPQRLLTKQDDAVACRSLVPSCRFPYRWSGALIDWRPTSVRILCRGIAGAYYIPLNTLSQLLVLYVASISSQIHFTLLSLMVIANTSPLTWQQIKLSIRDESQTKY